MINDQIIEFKENMKKEKMECLIDLSLHRL